MNIERTGWLISVIFALLFLGMTIYFWHKNYTFYQHSQQQLINTEEAKQFLKTHWVDKHPGLSEPLYIPTGIYVKSVYFLNANTVNVSGFIWQSYDKIKHKTLKRDFFLPDAINSFNGNARLIFHSEEGNQEFMLWYFETSLRQRLDYRKYPLDHIDIIMKILPADFDKNVILLPDYKSYDATGYNDIFGLSKTLALPGFRVHETFFDYALTTYDTNFGIKNYIGSKGFPDFTFNILLSRNIFQGIIFNVLPLFAVITLVFLFLLISTHDEKKVKKYNFSTAGILGSCGGLFFILVLSNLRLREEFAGSDIVFIEYFFILGYLSTIYVAINSVLFNLEKHLTFIQYRDNLWPKLLYWPFVTGMALLITLLVLGR